MTAKHIYECNLCETIIRPSADATTDGFGIWVIGDSLEFKAPIKAMNHICLPCANGIYDEYRKAILPVKNDGKV